VVDGANNWTQTVSNLGLFLVCVFTIISAAKSAVSLHTIRKKFVVTKKEVWSTRRGRKELTCTAFYIPVTFLFYCAFPCTFRMQHADLQGGPKSKPLPNDQKIVLNRIKTCE